MEVKIYIVKIFIPKMGRRPARCYRVLSKKAYIKSRFTKSCPESKLSVHDLGNRKAQADVFPLRVNLIAYDTRFYSSESLEAARIACNRYMLKNVGKENYHLRISTYPLQILRINKMLSCAGADRLQTGMRGSFGKPYGRASRVYTGQTVMCIRTKDAHRKDACEALRRGKDKLPGTQRVCVSQIHGFTGLTRDKFEELKNENRLMPVGNSVSIVENKGSIEKFWYKYNRAKEAFNN